MSGVENGVSESAEPENGSVGNERENAGHEIA